MRTDYLHQTTSVQFDGNGNGAVALRPSVGQYWAPTFVRISTQNQNPPFPHCTIYQGAISGSTAGPSSYVEDASVGNGDGSSIISGTVVQFGEAVLAKWTGGNPGDTGIITIYGTSCDTPTAVSDNLPTTPGTHFIGHAGADATVALFTVANDSIPANAGVKLYPPVAVSSFASFQLSIDTQNGAGGTFSFFRFTFIWALDAPGQNKLGQEDYVIASLADRVYHYVGNGPMISSYLSIQIINCDHVAAANTSFTIQGSSRPRTVAKIREKALPFFGPNGHLMVDNVLAAYSGTQAPNTSSANLLLRFYHGPATLDILSTGQAAGNKVQFTLSPEPNDEFNGSGGPGSYNIWDSSAAAVHSDIITTIDLPRRAMKMVVKNTDVNTITYFVMVIASEW